MVHHIHLSLVPITWSQTLTHEGATTLRARLKCEPHAELKLRNVTVYIVLNDFGPLGRAYVETDETHANDATIIEKF